MKIYEMGRCRIYLINNKNRTKEEENGYYDDHNS